MKSRRKTSVADERLLRELADRRALDDLIHRQANAVDSRDWTAFRSCFDTALELQLGSHGETVRGQLVGTGQTIKGAQRIIESVKQLILGLDSCQHTISNIVHDIGKDVARTVCQVVARHFLSNDRGDREFSWGGIYTMSHVRRAGEWKIKTWSVETLWYAGNPLVYPLAIQKGRAKRRVKAR